MEHLLQALGIVASLAAIAAPPAAVLGLVPRLGPARAVALALGSFRPRSVFREGASQRDDDVCNLARMLSTAHADQYVVASGPKGVGTTRVVQTALLSTFGVVYVYVAPGTPHDRIKADALTAITRYYLRVLDQTGSARRVLWWHGLLFRAPVTVVLQAAERKPAQPFADLDSAARALTQEFGVRVVIDASSNSLPDGATATKREKLLEVEPMSRELVERLPELAPLHAALGAAGLADVVWACVGGNPADYKGLWGAWKDRGCDDIELVVATFVQGLLDTAMKAQGDAVVSNKRLARLFALFRQRVHSSGEDVPYSTLAKLKLARPSPDKVLRVVRRRASAGSPGGGQRLLVPADAATSMVLRHGLTVTPSMNEIKALLLLK